jgi:hypothetical protein
MPRRARNLRRLISIGTAIAPSPRHDPRLFRKRNSDTIAAQAGELAPREGLWASGQGGGLLRAQSQLDWPCSRSLQGYLGRNPIQHTAGANNRDSALPTASISSGTSFLWAVDTRADCQAQFVRSVPVASVGPGWVGEPGGVNGSVTAPAPPTPPSACTGPAGGTKPSLGCWTF